MLIGSNEHVLAFIRAFHGPDPLAELAWYRPHASYGQMMVIAIQKRDRSFSRRLRAV